MSDARSRLVILGIGDDGPAGLTESARRTLMESDLILGAPQVLSQGYVRVLRSRGCREGEIDLPTPHSHGYNTEHDAAEDELASYCEWSSFPLEPDDDD